MINNSGGQGRASFKPPRLISRPPVILFDGVGLTMRNQAIDSADACAFLLLFVRCDKRRSSPFLPLGGVGYPLTPFGPWWGY